jgi:hypothetical protein
MLHVLTVASSIEKCHLLLKTAEWCDVNVEIIHMPEWRGYHDKIHGMISVLQFIPDDDLVVFIDAYDILCMGSGAEIVDKFQHYRCDLVFSSELNCFPLENYDAYARVHAGLAFPTRYRYLNSGGMVGYAWALRHVLQWKSAEDMERISQLGGDQNYFTQYYLEHVGPRRHDGSVPDRVPAVCLDVQQRIFQSLYKVSLHHMVFLEGRLYNHTLKTYPCFVHFNGSRDYHEEFIHEKDGLRFKVRAMDAFVGKMIKSRKYGNACMEYRWPELSYGEGTLPEV